MRLQMHDLYMRKLKHGRLEMPSMRQQELMMAQSSHTRPKSLLLNLVQGGPHAVEAVEKRECQSRQCQDQAVGLRGSAAYS